MAACPFFQTDVIELRSHEKRANMQRAPGRTVKMHWCSHANATVTVHHAHALGGANALQCGGDLERCQVPADLR